jgi:hypothetical protein
MQVAESKDSRRSLQVNIPLKSELPRRANAPVAGASSRSSAKEITVDAARLPAGHYQDLAVNLPQYSGV